MLQLPRMLLMKQPQRKLQQQPHRKLRVGSRSQAADVAASHDALAEAVENVVGRGTMLRTGAATAKDVTSVCDPEGRAAYYNNNK